jgi:hypothetical protein
LEENVAFTFSKLANFFTVVSLLAYSSTLKMKATCSSEMSVEFQRTIWPYFPQVTTLQAETAGLHIPTSARSYMKMYYIFVLRKQPRERKG